MVKKFIQNKPIQNKQMNYIETIGTGKDKIWDFIYTNNTEEFFSDLLKLDLKQYKSICFIDKVTVPVVSGLKGFVKSFVLETGILCKYAYVENDIQVKYESHTGDFIVCYNNNIRYVENQYDETLYLNKKLVFLERGTLSNLKIISSYRQLLQINQAQLTLE